MRRTVQAPSNRSLVRGSGADSGDSYLNKLVKYVPVEGLAPFIPIAAIAQGNDLLLWITFTTTLIVGLALIIAQARGEKTRAWYWPFVVVSFFAWSTGASEDFRALLGATDTFGAWLLGLTTVALPALDSALETVFPAR
jgi:hypothetical protein